MNELISIVVSDRRKIMKKKMLCKKVATCGVMVFLFGIYSVAVGETEPKVTTVQVTTQIVASSAHGS